MFNSEKLGVGKPEDCSWQLAGFQRPASQAGWGEPVDFFLPLFLLPLAPPTKCTLEPEAGWAVPKALLLAFTRRTSTVSPWCSWKRGDVATPPVGCGRCRELVGKAPWAA